MLADRLWEIAVTVIGLAAIVVGITLATRDTKQRGIEHVMKVCEETGMYLTEGKAMSCRVLKDQRG